MHGLESSLRMILEEYLHNTRFDLSLIMMLEEMTLSVRSYVVYLLEAIIKR